MAKGDVIERALIIIRMFEAGPVTARMIQDRFSISRNAAWRWIVQVSRFMPIVEDGKMASDGGRPGTAYRLMD